MNALFELPMRFAQIGWETTMGLAGTKQPELEPSLAPTPKSVVASEGTARLYRFADGSEGPVAERPAVLLVPSIINRWYVVDLRPGASLIEALVNAGFDVFCIDWGAPEDEDRYFDWDAPLARLNRMVRKTRRLLAPRTKLGIVGYCMGATITAIHVAMNPKSVDALINLLGPIDFSCSGRLGHAVDPRWFDVDAIADSGNVAASQMQLGFISLRPTAQIAKWVSLADRMSKPEAVRAFRALDTWASDNIAFPGEAYRRYIRELYQENQLAEGRHHVRGQRVDLSRIHCPVLAVVAERDDICPPRAATALLDLVSSDDTQTLRIPGGHVGAVVGSKAQTTLYPGVTDWLKTKL